MEADYFKKTALDGPNPRIGSSTLVNFIKSPDHALLKVKPTGFMESGRMFEDLVNQEVTFNHLFDDKYFKSDVDLSPDSAAWKKLLPIFEKETPPTAEEIESLYVYTSKKELHKTHKRLHRCLDQIKAHGFRRLIPANTSAALKEMLENFKLAPFEGANLFESLVSLNALFQQEHFWNMESGAKCRMKSDIELFYQDKAYIFDLKVTASFSSFVQNWKTNYIWQSRHYLEGFQRFCLENGIEPPDKIWYLISESTPPYLLHIWALSSADLDAMTPKYERKLAECQAWIDAGRPKKGYVAPRVVNRFGHPIEE